MTSRQPGATPQDWLLRLLPLALLIILGLAGLRGVVATPRWDGPLHRDGVTVGIALEVVLLILFVVTLGRTGSGSQEAAARKLRGMLVFTLGAGAVAVAVATLVGLHLHLFTSLPKKPGAHAPPAATPTRRALRPGSAGGPVFHIPVAALLYALLIVVLLVGVVVSIWWARRLRPSIGAREDGFIAHDSEDLREAAAVYHLRGWRRWRFLILPAIFPFLVTGMITDQRPGTVSAVQTDNLFNAPPAAGGKK